MARSLSPTVDANLGLLQEFDNCDGAKRTTRSLLPQEGM